MEQEIIKPVEKELLKSELTPDKQLRMTNKSHNEIYVVTAHDAPNVLREIGRLREIAFREAGGGTGKPLDLDEFDLCDNCYKQLIVWNPEEEEIIGGYRYLYGSEWNINDKTGQPELATSHMFHFSEKFLKEYMPYTVELGRSFVAVEYQNVRKDKKSIFALDNLWDGLGALTVINPDVKYFFGKMTMYPSYIRRGRDMILYFLKKHFDDKENLIVPMKPLKIEADPKELEALFSEEDFKADYRILNREIRSLGYNIPPLVNAYMNLSPTMKLFGTAINYGFGDVEETGILIAVDEILEDKRIRHIDSFIEEHPEALKITSGANNVIYKEK
ncbi:MAG: GNAT family N-acetyltransferase [Prevotella sp.]|nr:GNAT family N-acetyltransferase [Prevotella sp.]MDY2702971.1 GNAT family N-acetyltransferase [Prevotella sp.]